MGRSEASSRILTLDQGNTSLKALLWEDGQVVQCWRVFLKEKEGESQVPDSKPLPELEGVDEVRGVRVPGSGEPLLPASWPQVWWAGEALELPGRVLYRCPQEMGADRRVAAWGARTLHGRALVLDCGTALTLTHVDEEGEIHGLGISTGYGTLRRGLAQAAPALAGYLAEDVPLPAGLPEGSAENLSLGMIQGWAGLLERLLAEARRRLPKPSPLVLTGSDAPLAAELLGEGEVQAELLHVGLLALAWRV